MVFHKPIDINGAEGRNRTGTRLPSRDFKSLASTNSATPASFTYKELTSFIGSGRNRYYQFYYQF